MDSVQQDAGHMLAPREPVFQTENQTLHHTADGVYHLLFLPTFIKVCADVTSKIQPQLILESRIATLSDTISLHQVEGF